MEIPCPLAASAAARPGATAVSTPELTIDYAGLDRLVSGTADRLPEAGVRAGDRVALSMRSGWQAIVMILATIRAGATACPLSTRLPEAAVAHRCRRLRASLLIHDRLSGGIAGAMGAFGSGRPVAVTYVECLLGRADRPVAPLEADRPSTIVFSSGSTGNARAVVHTYGNHYHSALGSNVNIPLVPGDRWLASLPLFHVSGLGILFRCLCAGAAVMVPPAREPLSASVRRATHASMVCTQLRRLLRGHEWGVHPSKALLLGGSAFSTKWIDEAVDRGLPIHTSYGLTEMASQVAATPPGASRGDLHTSGRVLPHRELRIREGRILVRGATRFMGYAGYFDAGSDPPLNAVIDSRFGEALRPASAMMEDPPANVALDCPTDEALTPATMDADLDCPFDSRGWFATGDLGLLDDEERLMVLGRSDNLFISGGENILPERIESVLAAVDPVDRAIVVPVPDEEYGHRPVAFVETADGSVGTRLKGVLRAAVEAVLPRFMAPDAFYPWPVGADDTRMKVDRMGLRRLAESMSPSSG